LGRTFPAARLRVTARSVLANSLVMLEKEEEYVRLVVDLATSP